MYFRAPCPQIYVAIGTIGFLGILVLSGLLWALKTGRLSIDTIFETIFNEPICLACNIFINVADVAMLSVILFTVLLKNSKIFQDVIAAAWLFFVVGWLNAIYTIYLGAQTFAMIWKEKQKRVRHVIGQVSFLRKSFHASKAAQLSIIQVSTPEACVLLCTSLHLVSTVHYSPRQSGTVI